MVQRFDPVHRFFQGGSTYGEMKEDEHGDYVKYEEYMCVLIMMNRYKKALDVIASYDKDGPHQAGICPYGCDTPHIAQEALK